MIIMSREEIKFKLEEEMTPKRFIHSLSVMNMAQKLAQKYGLDPEKAALAGLLHDCARDVRSEDIFALCEKYNIEVDEISKLQPELLHGPLGAVMAREQYGITDVQILNSIHYHTTGHKDMGLFEKIIFLADYIEPNRNFIGIAEIRETAFLDVDKAIVIALEKTIKHVMSKGSLIHPDTVNARNAVILNDVKKLFRRTTFNKK